jgi:hypothetical protein
MNKDFLKALKKTNGKLLAIPEDVEESIKELSSAMNASSAEVLRSALHLLKYSLGREVRINKPNSESGMKIDFLKEYKTLTKFKGEDENED